MAVPFANAGAAVNTRSKSSEPTWTQIRTMPIRNAASPTRVTMKAFFAASAADFRSNQCPINKYEQSPTPSQPT